MARKYKIPVLAAAVFLITFGCTVKWTKAIHYGNVYQEKFSETIGMEIKIGLIFIPVRIGGKNYRFLFDSGAPFSISGELRTRHAFETLSTGYIVDSDQNRYKVDWVKVDTVRIGNVIFLDQTAFAGDFKANRIIDCLDIDGIIGSNLMRFCNWTIDPERKQLTLSSDLPEKQAGTSAGIPFEKDLQYNIFLDINIGSAAINRMQVDYGSNGSIALNKEIFKVLKERRMIGKTWTEKGVQQAGIIGEPVDIIDEIAVSGSVRINDLKLDQVLLKTGGSDLIGTKVLSRFVVTIDWENWRLHFRKTKMPVKPPESFGFRIGYSRERGICILSVIENSIAHQQGIRPDMKVLKVDELDFRSGNDFCDYLDYTAGDQIFLVVLDEMGRKREFILDKFMLQNE